MGKSYTFRQEFARILSSHHNPKPKRVVPIKKSQGVKFDSKKTMEESSSLFLDGRSRVPLSTVVSDCLKRWFVDTLREAKAGDTAMQVLVSQMYFNGYGVSKDSQKGRAWMSRASKSRASVWKVSDKRPGYNASDSDSDQANNDENNIT